MDVTQVLFMNRGEGASSYAVNSKLTQKVTSITKPILEREVQLLFSKENFPYKVLNVADLGCSSGPNTFSVISTVVESLEKKCLQLKREMPEIQFYLNDLPVNDFNTLFTGLSRFLQIKKGVSCFVMGTPGSFHGRLFPRNSMHLVHSSYSVHWLTQVPRLKTEEGLPLNKGKIYISKTSPPSVREIYLAQFQQDFTAFLKSRSQEMAPEGRIVLVLHGRRSADPACKESCYAWELIAEAISDMVSQGLIDEEKLDLFDVPYYTASVEEIQEVVETEGSFTAEQMEAIPVDAADPEDMADNWSKGVKMAKNIRSYTESMISHHFGEEILDKLYDRFTQIVVEDFPKESRKVISIILVLVRKEQES